MKNNNSGVTLLELLVIISIIMIMALGTSQLSFSRLSDRQKLDITANKIINNFESVRNNSLIGKGIGVNLDHPTEYQIEFTTSSTGGIRVFYYTGTTLPAILPEMDDLRYDIKLPMTFDSINCQDRNGTTNQTLDSGDSAMLVLKGKDISISGGCTNSSTRGLEINLGYRGHENSFTINSLNGLVERN